MIVGIDHIAFSSLDVTMEVDNFVKRNFKFLFQENLPNLSIKKDFLSNYIASHTLALLENNEGGYNIEILNHGQIGKSEGYIELIESNVILVKTDSIQESKIFWENLGFKFLNDTEAVFTPPFFNEKIFKIELKLDTNIVKRKLDDAGFNCIGLISTSIERDIKKLNQQNCYISAVENLKVNNKNMRICFVQRDKNEIVELIEVVKD